MISFFPKEINCKKWWLQISNQFLTKHYLVEKSPQLFTLTDYFKLVANQSSTTRKTIAKDMATGWRLISDHIVKISNGHKDHM